MDIKKINGYNLCDETAREEISKLNESITNGSGITEEHSNTLWALIQKMAFTEQVTEEELSAFKTVWGIENGGEEEPDTPIIPDEPDNPTEPTLTSIEATYSGGDVTVGTELTSLSGITVKANYSDGTSETVTDYTLSGEIVEGSNTITVTYQGMTTTFTVVGYVEVEAVVYNVFDGEYENSGYSGTLQESYGSNTNVYKTKIDVVNADKLYMRLAKIINASFGIDDSVQIGVYASDDTFLGTIKGASTKISVVDKYQPITPNLGFGVIETLEDGTEIHTKGIVSVSLEDYPTKSYVLVACKQQSVSCVATTWKGNAQSTSPLTLEGWV